MKNNGVILITGASSGIGKALAELYATPGRTLLLTGRDAERLNDVAQSCHQKGATVETTSIDVTDKKAFSEKILTWDNHHPIDLLIANAGISGGMGGSHQESETVFEKIMRINLDGTFNTVNPLISRMQERGHGQIVLMSSLAGFRGLPSAPAYSVSKNAVRAYAEALRPLLKKHNVGVSVICPGFIKTPLTDVNTFPMPFLMAPEKAAEKMKAGIDANKAVIAFPWPMVWGIKLMTLLPRCISDWILGKAPKKP